MAANLNQVPLLLLRTGLLSLFRTVAFASCASLAIISLLHILPNLSHTLYFFLLSALHLLCIWLIPGTPRLRGLVSSVFHRLENDRPLTDTEQREHVQTGIPLISYIATCLAWSDVHLALSFLWRVAVLFFAMNVFWLMKPLLLRLQKSTLCWPHRPRPQEPSALEMGRTSLHGISSSYRPLDNNRDIRLIRLGRKRPFSKLNCKLVHVDVDQAPAYEAISYTWGNKKLSHELVVDGKPIETSAQVHEIVHGRWSFWRTRHLWIDFICINQSDIAEKSVQVCLMRDIFQQASRVIVWLGNSEDADDVPIMLAHLQLMRTLTTSGTYMQSRGFLLSSLQGARRHQMPALIKFLCHAYWLRVWIIQEIAVADVVHVFYGGNWIAWETMLSGLESFRDVNPHAVLQNPNHVKVGDRIPDLEITQISTIARLKDSIQRKHLLSLPEILHTCSKVSATDPKDKVYALLGLTSAAATSVFVPDYDKSTTADRVYIETARYLLTFDEPLLLLHQAGIGHERILLDHEEKLLDLPSWVPDWSKAPKPFLLAQGKLSPLHDRSFRYRASSDIVPRAPPSLVNNTLTVEAVYIDVISDVQENFLNASSHNFDMRVDADAALAWLNEARKTAFSRTPLTYKNGQHQNEAFQRTIIGDRTIAQRPAPAEFVAFYDAWSRKLLRQFGVENQYRYQPSPAGGDREPNCLRSQLGLGPHEDVFYEQIAAIHFEELLYQASFGRKFAVTATGYMTLVPPYTKIGNLVYVILGTETPFVVSSCRDRGGCQLVGEAYVHGIMDGEALQPGRVREFITLC